MRLINDVLPTATIAMNENNASGNHGAPARTTSSRSAIGLAQHVDAARAPS